MVTANVATAWHVNVGGGFDAMKATFRTHQFPPHAHETYVIEVIELGSDDFRCIRDRALARRILNLHRDFEHPSCPLSLETRLVGVLADHIARSFKTPSGANR